MSILNTKVLAIGAAMVFAIGCDLDGDGQVGDAEVEGETVEQDAEGVDLGSETEPAESEETADQRKQRAQSLEAAE
jgi:hypothetical protein|tara:strand:- start:6710 stop:6937 length:228 start_codon:yes stop_codon:yes gene_type:complete